MYSRGREFCFAFRHEMSKLVLLYGCFFNLEMSSVSFILSITNRSRILQGILDTRGLLKIYLNKKIQTFTVTKTHSL
jgi:hypothetical protein